MEEIKNDQDNQEQPVSPSTQPTTSNLNATSANNPVEQKEKKHYPNTDEKDVDTTIKNGPKEITDVPDKDQKDAKEIVNDEAQQEPVTNIPSNDYTGSIGRGEDVNL